jgi:hypothetical protein
MNAASKAGPTFVRTSIAILCVVGGDGRQAGWMLQSSSLRRILRETAKDKSFGAKAYLIRYKALYCRYRRPQQIGAGD